MPKWAIVGSLWIWFAVALLTHYGARSPYSYAGAVIGLQIQRIDGLAITHRIDGLVVNHDAPSVRPVTQFFYDGSDLAFGRAHNLKAPVHSLLVAAVASFLRSYMLASYLVNLLALWLLAYVAVALAESMAFPRAATLIASLTCAFLPIYTHYIGQPMHYIVGIVVNFLVVMAAMAGVRDPLRLGILTAILTLGYDPYVFIAALAAWGATALRWRSIREWGTYIAASLLPVIVWRGFLGLISDEAASRKVRFDFLDPVVEGWLGVLTSPGEQLLTPFVSAHLGVLMSVEMMLALVYWPVLILCVIGARPGLNLPTLLAFFFVLEQLVTAAYDWENNPRRAFSLLFALSCALFVAVRSRVHLRRWRIAFVVVMVVSAFLTMADALIGNPVIGYMPTGEAMRDPTKRVVDVSTSRLDTASYPTLKRDETPAWWSMSRARVTRPAIFVFANLFVASFVIALLHLLRERALLPRYVPAAAAAVFLLSLGARFV